MKQWIIFQRAPKQTRLPQQSIHIEGFFEADNMKAVIAAYTHDKLDAQLVKPEHITSDSTPYRIAQVKEVYDYVDFDNEEDYLIAQLGTDNVVGQWQPVEFVKPFGRFKNKGTRIY